MVKKPTATEMCAELEDYIDLEGTEIGEYWELLRSIERYCCHMSTKFYNAYIAELHDQLTWIKQNAKIVECEEEVVIREKTRRLEWVDGS